MGIVDRSREGHRVGYAAVWCPDFKLQAVVGRAHSRAEAIVLVDDTRRQSVVLSRNEPASRWGVDPGMRTVQALARCPGLRVERPSASAELSLARTLLETALCWVPGIEETEEGWLTLDLSTQVESEREESARRLRGACYTRGIELVIGLGETPSLARIAALAARQLGESAWSLRPEERLDQLDGLPLAVGEVGDELRERLTLWGIESLGAFARLSREAVAARLGDEGVELWLRLAGQIRRPLRFAKLEELFEEHHEFEYEVREREPLLFVVHRFLEQLIERVGRTGRAATAVHLLLRFADGSCHARRLALPEPVLDHEILFHLVGGHIEGLEVKAAIEVLRLRFEPSDPVASQRTLFGAGLKNRFQFEETMKRLRQIVGSEKVGSPRLVDSHRPGAFSLVPLPTEIGEGRLDGNIPTAGPPITGMVLRRFRGGVRTGVQMIEGRPFRIDSRPASGLVVGWSGPWHHEGEWWHRGREWSRIEWDVEIRGEGVFRLVHAAGEWILEGRYE